MRVLGGFALTVDDMKAVSDASEQAIGVYGRRMLKGRVYTVLRGGSRG